MQTIIKTDAKLSINIRSAQPSVIVNGRSDLLILTSIFANVVNPK